MLPASDMKRVWRWSPHGVATKRGTPCQHIHVMHHVGKKGAACTIELVSVKTAVALVIDGVPSSVHELTLIKSAKSATFLRRAIIASAMKAILPRNGSVQVTMPSLGLVSPGAFTGHDSCVRFSFPLKNGASVSSRTSVHLEVRDSCKNSSVLRRVRSETDLSWPGNKDNGFGFGLRRSASTDLPSAWKPRRSVKDEDLEPRSEILMEDEVSVIVEETVGCVAGMGSIEKEVTEELWFGRGGNGGQIGGRNGGGSRGKKRSTSGGGDPEPSGAGAYYKEMLKANPRNPLLLRNYGKYLHEVEKDAAKAEEYYGRAILESPVDGEVLCLYAKLLWDRHRNEKRAEIYFKQAIKASPDDCYVLASYAHFLWDAGEEEDKQEEMVIGTSSLIATY